MPPKKLVDEIGGDYIAVGNDFFQHFRQLVGVSPDRDVLDVGCGRGRMAVPFTKYLEPTNRYCGFDVNPAAIRWCRKHITSRHPNFEFDVADLRSVRYNPRGRHLAHEYRFPWDDDSFDFVFLTSVFTHMLPRDVQYFFLDEIVRVLRSGGKCLITFFLLNDESLALSQQGKSTQDFKHAVDGCRVVDRDVPEAAVSYLESDVRGFFESRRLSIDEPIRYGSWCGRPEHLSYQDIVVAELKG
ncbi:MAG: class I SAM-dependent methyltransferase [Gammaproteobacteria bacterium]|nr:class I SAM-dependent methyltransferase [Gammaproteobacteria bacterium]